MAKRKFISLQKPSERKGGTPSSRHHHFEGFSQRIAKINIDPVRKFRHNGLEDDLSAAGSFFKTALDEWTELNLSKNFVAFAQVVQPFCDTLPQLLHHENAILDLLIEYIEKGDTISMEPLLNLMSHFAHDLGARFEKHFARSVSIITRIASQHADVEVIEWSFTCLAWLFKYLSRLLVPDLRPVYDLLSPLLGEERQKTFIVRFAAESLSFLLRKSASASHRKPDQLRVILEHIVKRLNAPNSSQENSELFLAGNMTLLTESVKGVQRNTHSGGVALFGELMRQVFDVAKSENVMEEVMPAERALYGVLIAVIHHTESGTFTPLLDQILEKVKSTESGVSGRPLTISSRLLFLISGVRNGTRVEKWSQLVARTSEIVQIVDQSDSHYETRLNILTTLGVVLQACPLEEALSEVRLLDRLTQDKWKGFFLSFCIFFAELGQERFASLLLPLLKRFMSTSWADHGEQLCILLPSLCRSGFFTDHTFVAPTPWQEAMASAFDQLDAEPSDMLVYKCSAYMETTDYLRIDQNVEEFIFGKISSTMKLTLKGGIDDKQTSASRFACGAGFKCLVLKKRVDKVGIENWPALCILSEVFPSMLTFWEAMLGLIEIVGNEVDLAGQHMQHLYRRLFDGVSSPSRHMRLVTLRILRALHKLEQERDSDLLSTALSIEDSPLTIDSSRAVSMHVRKFGLAYTATTEDDIVAQTIPRYCFGVLHLGMTPVWDDSCESLKAISNTKKGEAIISELAFRWLKEPASKQEVLLHDSNESAGNQSSHRASEFECSNVNKIDKVSGACRQKIANSESELRDLFGEKHREHSLASSTNRAHALRVLNKVPQIAEKHSRTIVPVLLRWANIASQESSNEILDGRSVELVSDRDDDRDDKWTRKDQKAMLNLFAQFHNPKVLYKSEKVFKSLLSLLCNGDVEIQRSALKALMTWKNQSINRYEEHLVGLLDDAKFREQISVFLDVDEDNKILQSEDREHLLPVLLRMLYGRIVTRSGSAKGGQASRRKALFITLVRFGDDVVEQFLDIALGKMRSVHPNSDVRPLQEMLHWDLVDIRKQTGLLTLVKDMIHTLGHQIRQHFDLLVSPVLFCAVQASWKLKGALGESDSEQEDNNSISLLRVVRQTGIHCLTALTEIDPSYKWAYYVPIIVEEIIKPRLEKLPIDTAQSVSGLLKLFAAWSSSIHTAMFLNADQRILVKVAECLGQEITKEDVKTFILQNIIQPLVKVCRDDANEESQITRHQIQTETLEPCSSLFLSQICCLLRSNSSRNLLDIATSTLCQLAECVHDMVVSSDFIEICCFLLQQPSKRVSPKTKSELLGILWHFIPSCDFTNRDHLFKQIFDTLSSLFAFFKDRISRVRLCAAFRALAASRTELQEIADLCEALNSYSESRIDEPDFQRRSAAFARINEEIYSQLDVYQWRPVVFNMLYYIKDQEELAVRTSASFGLRRFVEATAEQSFPQRDLFMCFLEEEVLPAMHDGIRLTSELVRAEYLMNIAAVIRLLPEWKKVHDMQGLLVGNDEEASFFTNILHIQQHRRIRALKRLSAAARAGHLSASNIYSLFIPLLEHFVFDQEDSENARALAAETIHTISALAEGLEWPQYRPLLRRFTAYVETKPEMQRTIVKLLGATIDALNRAARSRGLLEAHIDHTPVMDDGMEAVKPSSKLSSTLPSKQKLSQELNTHVLNTMTSYLHHKDESTVSLRVPVAIAATKLLQILPVEEHNIRLPGVLLDVCNILRSRASESRDMSRKTLAEIASIVGPDYFGFIFKALRNALQRGYQLHVLSYTVHSILLACSPRLRPGDLDDTAKDIVAIIMDDIFGVTGQEKDSVEYISKMKEVKSSKSFDSLEILSKLTTLPHVADLIRPIRALLQENLSSKLVKKIDELLRRIGVGISQSEISDNPGILTLCYEIIQETHRAEATPDRDFKQPDYKTRRYLINMNGRKGAVKGTTTSYLYKTTRFAFDLLRATLKKHPSLQTASNLAGFLPAIHDAIVTGQEEVQISALRLLSAIIKMKWPQLDDEAPEYIYQSVRIVKASPSTNTEVAQAALKLVAATLRERQNVAIKENDIAFLLKRIKPDLEEPDRQGVTFNFLKSVLGRKIIIAEIYEILDQVSSIMITNQTKSTRDLARGVYFQFLMEYPQKKKRFDKQLQFLLGNLQYDHMEGRQSVMEALHLIISKFGDDLVEDVLTYIFVPLVMVMTNDASRDCREMAGVLIKKIFERSGNQRRKDQRAHLRSWLQPDKQLLIQRVSLQCWGLYLEVHSAEQSELAFLLEQMSRLLEENIDCEVDDAWEVLYFTLQAFMSICKASPEVGLSSEQRGIWAHIQGLVSYPHAWVKGSAARLLSMLFDNLARSNGSTGLQHIPLLGSGGLSLDANAMLKLMTASLRALKVPGVSQETATQMAQNLLFLGRCFAANQSRYETSSETSAAVAEDSETSSAGEEEDIATADSPRNPKLLLQVLLERLSSILRRDVPNTRASALYPKTASIRVIGSLCNLLSTETLLSCLSTILLPLHNLTDPSIPTPRSLDDGFNNTYQELKNTALEVMDVLKEKLGSTTFVDKYQEVRRDVQERREGRKVKRKIDAVARPERIGEIKKRKREGERKKRKERNMEFRGRRRGY